jgi:hypothetical protein
LFGALLLGFLVFLVTAAAARAQTTPFPTLPPDPAVGSAGSPGGPLGAPLGAWPEPETASRPRPWEYSLGAGVGWDSNVNFDYQIESEASSFALTPRGTLDRIFWGPRGDLRAGVNGRWVAYPNASTNRYYVDFDLNGQYRSSTNTTWAISANYDLGHSDSSRILSDQGLLLPLVETRTLTSQAGVSQRLGGRTSVRLGGRFYLVEFVDAPAYTDGRSLRGSATFDWRLTSRDTASIEYALENVLADPEGRTYRTHFGSLQWSRLFSSRSALLLEGGASYTPDAELAGLRSEASFFGGLSFSRQVKRSTVSLYVRREVVPAFGFGVSRAETRGGLAAVIPLGSVWQLRLSAYGVRPSTPEDLPATYSAVTETALGLGRRLGRRLELSAEARYRRRGATSSLPFVQSFQGGLILSLLSPGAQSLLLGN